MAVNIGTSAPTTPADEPTTLKLLGSQDDSREDEESELVASTSTEKLTDSDEEERNNSVNSPDNSRDGEKRESVIRLEAEEQGVLKVLCKACEEGELGTVQFLLRSVVSNVDLSTAKFSEGGLTPLHLASKNGYQDIVKLLLDKGASTMIEDQARNTPLHLAATHGHLEVAKDLLAHESRHNEEKSESARSNLLQMTNASGLSPLGCAVKAAEPQFHIAKEFLNVTFGNPANAIPDFSKSQLFPKFTTLPLDKPAKIFIVGDSMAGKSTLVKCLQEGKSAFPRLLIGLISSRLVTEIDAHFSGVIATDFYNASFHRVIFYDLAGHTNYFNESLLEPSDNLEHIIFVVVINLRFNRQSALERLVYWLNFLHYHTSGLFSERASTKPSIVIVGSHKDMKRGVWREKLNEVYTEVLKERPQLSECFNLLMKPVSLDCRRFEASEARQLRSCLHKHCQNFIYQQAASPPSICYILSQVLFDSKEFPPYLTLAELAQTIADIAERPGLNLCKLLPTEPAKVMEICKTLCEHDRLLIFDNPASSSDLDHWIVHNTHSLLTEIDKRLLTLKNMSSGSSGELETTNKSSVFQQMDHSHFGIVTREILESVFSGSPKPTRKSSLQSAHKVGDSPPATLSASSSSGFSLNPNLAIELLLKFKYCEVTKHGDPSSPAEVFFFPGLLLDVGEPEPWEGANYGFAWCVVTSRQEGKIIEYFLPRFLKKLLLRFIEKFVALTPSHRQLQEAEQPPHEDTSSMSSSNETSAVWSRGVSWLTNDGIRVNIELNDNAIILSMYSQEGSELNCLQLRNKILATIKDEQKKWQPDIATNEFIIPFKVGIFPVQALDNHQKIPLESIKEAILKGNATVDEIDVQSLLFFEPCISLSRLTKPIQDTICDPEQEIISQEYVLEIFAEFGKARSAFVQHFSLSDLNAESTPESLSSARQSVTTESEEEIIAPSIDSNAASPKPSSQAGSSRASNQGSITAKKLLECMNSISIMDAAEFLHNLEEYQLSTPSRESIRSNSLERDDVQLDFGAGTSKNSTLKRSHQVRSSFVPYSASDLPFIETPSVFQCSSEGKVYNSKAHGIKLVFPPGAISKGTLDIEMGVLLSGPFTFSANVKPISPILWLCVKTNRCHKFNKPIDITLPHFMDCTTVEEQNRFAFYKATHNDSVTDQSFTFKEINSDRSRFTTCSGTLTTKHCCFICIVCKEPQDQLIDKSNYCLVSVVPRNNLSTTFTMHFCLTFHLKTCIEVLQKQFPECDISNRKVFKFAQQVSRTKGSAEQHAITIQFNTHLSHGWIAGNVGFGSKITASDVDFFKSEAGYLRHLEDDEYYPPRFTIEVNGSSAIKADLLCVNFKGATDKLEFQKTLALPHNPLSASLDRVSSDDAALDVAMGMAPPAASWQRSPSTSTGLNDSRTASIASIHSLSTSGTLTAVGATLEHHLDILIKCLNVDQVRPLLRQYGVLLPEEADKLIDLNSQHNTSHSSVVEKLVTMLSSKGASGLYHFVRALEDSTDGTGHQDILKELREDPEFKAAISEYGCKL